MNDLKQLEDWVAGEERKCTDELYKASTLRFGVQMVPSEEEGKEDKLAPVVHIGEDGDRLSLMKTGVKTLCGFLKIPKSYFNTLIRENSELLIRNVNQRLRDCNGGNIVLMRYDESNVRAVVPEEVKVFKHSFLLRAVEKLQSNFSLKLADGYLGDDFLLKVDTTVDRESYVDKVGVEENRVGDLVGIGFSLCNSEIGLVRPRIEPYFMRLSCSNGMIVKDKRAGLFLKRFGGDGSSLDDAVKVISSWLSGVELSAMRDRVSARMNLSVTENVKEEDLDICFRGLKRFGVKERDLVGVKEAFMKEKILSKWGVFNAVTRYANAVKGADNYRLQTAAYRYLVSCG